MASYTGFIGGSVFNTWFKGNIGALHLLHDSMHEYDNNDKTQKYDEKNKEF